ncbi:hypothetical protein FAZ69_04265 [Trinickia terrae]|uniref:Histidine phosphatase family protein n=1 Tax=Trinickia terrae TaxID=2571161 RepID=A0A4U1IDV9_9BURK|nr:hypothetical protein [Trinickia terrae]TKC91665.1 hypothetical protein FAZ69_04265 [Trinickia terrae]
MAAPTAKKIMIIRHAEKPDDKGKPYGVNADGEEDKESLTTLGWQRAGALVALFDPARGPLQSTELAKPDVLFAAVVAPHAKSERPTETITPLSERLAIALNVNGKYTKGQEADVAKAALASQGAVLICWQHEDIPAIAGNIPLSNGPVPQKWPDDRFDLVWVFDLQSATGQYGFSQVPQELLAGDRATVIS